MSDLRNGSSAGTAPWLTSVNMWPAETTLMPLRSTPRAAARGTAATSVATATNIPSGQRSAVSGHLLLTSPRVEGSPGTSRRVNYRRTSMQSVYMRRRLVAGGGGGGRLLLLIALPPR